ncbi:MAG: CBS domain-containing protein [Micavibrio aeruginosavorus]|uniref:CBS domain-containing protein n=1 Tax=Micavibrio aeruginosavorus TaxID=349221 RepID=A0A7T5R4T0_9BACT|nr:MAG: CBS domain-containing protein [Micavibrio aeruginosavorus]
MTDHPVLVTPKTTLKEAAAKMRDIDCGILPIGTEDKLKGIITDRDIVTRAVAKGKDISKELVKDYMTEEVFSCNEHDTLEDAADKMRIHRVSRLVVKNKAGKVVGILSFGGILRKDADAGEVANIVKHATHMRAI